MTIIMTPSITSCTRGGITIEFSEMRGPNKIFGPFIFLQNGPNILLGPLISENSMVTPPLVLYLYILIEEINSYQEARIIYN